MMLKGRQTQYHRLGDIVGQIPADIWFLGLMVLALGLRLHGLTSDGLWYDELLTVVRAYPSLRTALITMWNDSTHPPLYQAQLHLWLQFGTSDLWIRLNPLLWDMLSLVSLYFLTKRAFSEKVALWATLFLTLSPFHIYYAQEVRMYGLMIFLAVWAWFSTHQVFKAPRAQLAWAALAGLASLAYLYSHGAGFMILASVNSLAAWYVITNQGRQRVWLWGGLQLAVLLLYVPWLHHAWNRGVAHPLAPSPAEVVETLYYLLAGFPQGRVEVGLVHLLPLVVLLCSVALVWLWQRRRFGVVLSFVLVPALFCYLVSHLVKPIWLFRTLAYTIPFVCLTFSLAIAPSKEMRAGPKATVVRSGMVVLVLGIFVAGFAFQKLTHTKLWDLRDAAVYMAAAAEPGDVVWIPNQRLFMTWNWYFAGPGSIDPLAVPAEVREPSLGVRVVTGTGTRQEIPPQWLVYRNPEELGQSGSWLDSKDAWLNEEILSGIHVIRIEAPSQGGRP